MVNCNPESNCIYRGWYYCINGEKTDVDYHSAIWIPVRRKCNS